MISDLPTQPAPPTVASFFAGIGGFELGFELAGFETVWQCEVKPFCLEILEQHWPAVPKATDIREVVPDDIPEATVWTGGFPCQDVSLARMGAKERAQRSAVRAVLRVCATHWRSSPPVCPHRKRWRPSLFPRRTRFLQSSFGRWPNSGMVWHGECLTVATSESPRAVIESSLSDLLEDQKVPDQYFLSPNAATGMLRRAERMGRNLFPPLKSALEILSKGTSRS